MPESLWPFAADTNRFNHDTGLPGIVQVTDAADLQPGKYRLRMRLAGYPLEWDEEPFDWVYPSRFGVLREYRNGPVKEMRVLVEMQARPEGGTRLRYRVWARPANLFGDLAIQVVIGQVSARRFMQVFRHYDAIAVAGGTHFDLSTAPVRFAAGGQQRLEAARPRLDGPVFERLEQLLKQADDLSLQRMRPYPLADHWKLPRRLVLETFLRASRLGILDLRWELLCPMCRGVGESRASLSEVHNGVHCNFCNLDFDVDFDRQVEVIFRPNLAIRPVPEGLKFCLSGPQSEPHAPVNVRLAAGGAVLLEPVLESGHYVISAMGTTGGRTLIVDANGERQASLSLLPEGWEKFSLHLAPAPALRLLNGTDMEQRIQLERQAWRDDAASAADVTCLQIFRDLFSREALRVGEEIAIRNVTLMFTDLRDSTRMYRQLGDAPAYGRVRQHFEALEQAIAAEGGAVVKTMGDAVMAVFRQPVAALRAIQAAHRAISIAEGAPPLYLKVGIHQGPCIAVTLNERLDYFGSSVNVAARLPGLAEGGQVIFSDEIKSDLEVEGWLKENRSSLQNFQAALKGFDEPFALWKVTL